MAEFTRLGDRFMLDDEPYMLARVADGMAALIGLKGGTLWSAAEDLYMVVGVPVSTMVHNFGTLSGVRVRRVRRPYAANARIG